MPDHESRSLRDEAMRHAPNPVGCRQHPYFNAPIIVPGAPCHPACHYRIPHVDLRVADIREQAAFTQEDRVK